MLGLTVFIIIYPNLWGLLISIINNISLKHIVCIIGLLPGKYAHSAKSNEKSIFRFIFFELWLIEFTIYQKFINQIKKLFKSVQTYRKDADSSEIMANFWTVIRFVFMPVYVLHLSFLVLRFGLATTEIPKLDQNIEVIYKIKILNLILLASNVWICEIIYFLLFYLVLIMWLSYEIMIIKLLVPDEITKNI